MSDSFRYACGRFERRHIVYGCTASPDARQKARGRTVSRARRRAKAFIVKAIVQFAAAGFLRSLQAGRAAQQPPGRATIRVQICRIGCG